MSQDQPNETHEAATPVAAAQSPTAVTVIRPNGKAYTYDPNKKVAICGFASSSRPLTPFNDPTFELWGLNSLYAIFPMDQIDPARLRWFEIHPYAHFTKDLNRGELKERGLDHHAWLSAVPGPGQPGHFPIYCQEHYDDIPASVRWPRAEINAWSRELFGAEFEIDYFTSTPAEMIAQAIYEGYGEIRPCGIDLISGDEYEYQRPCFEFWVGIARGLGIKVVIPPTSAPLKANYVYGYTEPPVPGGATAELEKYFGDMPAKLEAPLRQDMHELGKLIGRFEATVGMLNYIKTGKPLTTEAMLPELERAAAELQKSIGMGQMHIHKQAGHVEAYTNAAAWVGAWGRGDKLAQL